MKKSRPYQVEAIQAISGRMEDGSSTALIVLASGLGKTVVSAKVARQWRESRKTKVLFLVHMNEAVEQAVESFLEEFEDAPEMFDVVNGDTKERGATLVFSTFQTMRNRLEEYGRGEFGLIIVDEAHHGQAVTYKDVLDYFQPQFLFGMTATPDRMDGLDIRDIFGDEVYKYGLAEALAEGKWLAEVDYRVMLDNVDVAQLEKLVKRVYGGDRMTQPVGFGPPASAGSFKWTTPMVA